MLRDLKDQVKNIETEIEGDLEDSQTKNEK